MIIVKIFKFESNLEYISSYLKEKHIPHFADFKNKSLLSEEKTKDEILKIIADLQIDENDVEPEKALIEGYQEWNENMYNPGYYSGGKSPSFNFDKNNYLTYAMMTFVCGLACLVQEINSKNFNKFFFWLSVLTIFLISFSLLYQYLKYKKRNSK